MGGFAAKVIKSPVVKPVPAPAYTPSKPEVSQAQSTAIGKTDMARGKGRSSTILTGARGLGDNKLTTKKYTLLGG